MASGFKTSGKSRTKRRAVIIRVAYISAISAMLLMVLLYGADVWLTKVEEDAVEQARVDCQAVIDNLDSTDEAIRRLRHYDGGNLSTINLPKWADAEVLFHRDMFMATILGSISYKDGVPRSCEVHIAHLRP